MNTIAKQGNIIKVGKGSFRDPANISGTYIPALSLYQTYRVDQGRIKDISEQLYENVLHTVNSKDLGDALLKVTTYTEDSYSNAETDGSYHNVTGAISTEVYNQSRTYIILTRNTLRSTRATILIRFLTYGGYLYVGVDTYVLGPLNILAVAKKTLFTLLQLILVTVLAEFLLGSTQADATGLVVMGYFIWVAIYWWEVIRKWFQTSNMLTALRLGFNKELDLGSFNLDDVAMFTKSSLHTAVSSIKKVFERADLPIDSLDAFERSINNVSINTGGGSITMTNSSVGQENTTTSTSTPAAPSTPTPTEPS